MAADRPCHDGRWTDDLVFVDVDDIIREVCGCRKDGAGFGCSGVRGLNALITTICMPSTAPVVA